MSTTTKIFIVLVCLFAFIFTPMTIQFGARADRWQDLVNRYQDIAVSSQVHNRNLIALTIAEKQAMDEELASMRRTVQDTQDANLTLQDQLDQTQVEKAGLDAENLNLQTTVKLLAASVKVKTDENSVLTDANTNLRQHNDVLMTRNIELNDRNKELSTQLLIRQQKLRMLEEENLAIRQENGRLRQGEQVSATGGLGPVGPAQHVEALGPAATSPIRGQITDVQGDNAEINVGSADGVKKGMIFVIRRDETYLGDLKIEVVEPGTAVGRLEMTGQGEIRVGDLVCDKLSLMAAR